MSYDETSQAQPPPSPKLHSSPVHKDLGAAATARAAAAQPSSSSLDLRMLDSPSPSPPPPSTSPQTRAETPRTHYWAPRVPRQPIPTDHKHVPYVDNGSKLNTRNGHLGGGSGTVSSTKGIVSFEDLESAIDDEFAFGNFGLFDGSKQSQDPSLQASSTPAAHSSSSTTNNGAGNGDEYTGDVTVPLAAPRPTRGALHHNTMHSLGHGDSSQSSTSPQVEANLDRRAFSATGGGGHAAATTSAYANEAAAAAAPNNPWAHEAQAGASLAARGPQLVLLGKRVIAHARAAPAHTARVMGTAAQPSRFKRLWPWCVHTLELTYTECICVHETGASLIWEAANKEDASKHRWSSHETIVKQPSFRSLYLHS